VRNYWVLFLAPALVSALAMGIAAWSGAGKDEEQVSLDQVPPAVKATILKEAQGATIQEIERQTQAGEVTYEANVIIGAQEVEIEVAADGTLLGKQVDNEEDDEEHDD